MIAAGALPRALSHAVGLDLSAYRDDYVAERVQRAVERERVHDVSELTRLLVADASARSRFRRSVAVSVSGLFRDPTQFELLERDLLPPLVAAGRRLRVWSAGCADGTELYSLAMLLDRLGALDRAFLLGSDLLEENLDVACQAAYLEPRVRARLRPRMRWERRDLVRDGRPGGRWDLVLCRNLAIYLSSAAKQALHRALADSLSDRGVLLLGRSERIAAPEALALVPAGPHAYRRTR